MLRGLFRKILLSPTLYIETTGDIHIYLRIHMRFALHLHYIYITFTLHLHCIYIACTLHLHFICITSTLHLRYICITLIHVLYNHNLHLHLHLHCVTLRYLHTHIHIIVFGRPAHWIHGFNGMACFLGFARVVFVFDAGSSSQHAKRQGHDWQPGQTGGAYGEAM